MSLAKQCTEYANKYHKDNDVFERVMNQVRAEIKEQAKKGEYSMYLTGYTEVAQQQILTELKKDGFKLNYYDTYGYWEISWRKEDTNENSNN